MAGVCMQVCNSLYEQEAAFYTVNEEPQRAKINALHHPDVIVSV